VSAGGDVEADLAAFRRGAVDLIEASELAERLARARAERRPLRVKFGMDPSSPDLHLGHAIPLLLLRSLQDLGHQVVLIVGDATARLGDPSGRNKLRPQLSRAEVEANLATYTEQAARVIDMERAEVRRNSEWFDRMGFDDVLRLMGRMTLARMIERDTFARRIERGEPVGLHELLYPLMQGWDSVMVRCDVEIGGTDQLFNLLVGRELQRAEGQPGQVCLTLPLINGLDGRKMSKSYGNAIGLTESAAEMFGKVMSIPDEALADWLRLLTPLSDEERARLLEGHPREAKARLAEEIAARFHGREAARAAREGFDRQFRDRELPESIPELYYPGEWPARGVPLAVLLREVALASSSSDARRLVEQGGVRVDGEVVRDPMLPLVPARAGHLLQIGRRRVARVFPATSES
jgi:tyrosyl-tRNA synthetase